MNKSISYSFPEGTPHLIESMVYLTNDKSSDWFVTKASKADINRYWLSADTLSTLIWRLP